MTFSAVTWAAGDEITSAKLAQMVANIAEHDHRFAGGRGTPIARVAVGVAAVTPTGTTITYQTVSYPLGVFDAAGPVPVPIVSPEANSANATVRSAGTRTHTANGFDVGLYRTNTAVTNVYWIAVQAPA